MSVSIALTLLIASPFLSCFLALFLASPIFLLLSTTHSLSLSISLSRPHAIPCLLYFSPALSLSFIFFYFHMPFSLYPLLGLIFVIVIDIIVVCVTIPLDFRYAALNVLVKDQIRAWLLENVMQRIDADLARLESGDDGTDNGER